MSGTGGVLNVPAIGGDAEGMWMSVSDIARIKGVEKSSVSRRINRLVEQDLLEVRPGPGGQKLVILAAYERAADEATDAVREANGGQRGLSAKGGGGSGLAREQARRVAYQADLAEIELGERRGLLLPVEGVSAAVAAASEKIVKRLRGMPSMADDLAVATARGGADAVRTALEVFAQDLISTSCEAFAAVVKEALPANSAGTVRE